VRVVVERDRAVGAEQQALVAAEKATRAEQQALAQRALAEGAEARAVTERDQAEQARQEAQTERDAARAAERQAARERERARASEQLALEESDTSHQVSDLLVGLFEGADPAVSGQPDLSSVTLVDRGRERINEQLGSKPQLQARMQGVLGRVYENMGRQQLALQLYDQALAKETRPDTRALLLTRRAMALGNANQGALAVASARQALQLYEAGAGTPRERAGARDTLGYVLMVESAFDESRQQLDRALQERRQLLGPAHLEIASTLHHQGMLAAAQGQFETAEQRFREALAMKRSLVGPGHLSVQSTLQVLSTTLASLQRLDEAEQMLHELVRQRRQVLGPDAMPVAVALNELAGVQQDSGQLAKAIASYRETIAIQNKTSGPRSARVAVTINNLATALEDAGDPAAEAAYRESLSIRQATLPAGDLGVARVQHNLGRWLLRQGQLAEAGPLLEQGAAARAARLAPQHHDALDSTLVLAELALRSGELELARQRIEAAAAFEPGMRVPRRITLLRAQGLLLAAQGQAAAALLKHQAAAELARQALAPGLAVHLRLRLELAQAQWAANGPGDRDAARRALPALLTALQAQPADAPLHRSARVLATAAER
jgi:serine/threonine-protein kinase